MRLATLAMTLALLAGCKKPSLDDVWVGIPTGLEVTCAWSQSVGACVGSGKAYTCVHTRRNSETHTWNEFQCARVSSPVLPEEPPSND